MAKHTKYLIFILALLLSVLFASCSRNAVTANGRDEIRVHSDDPESESYSESDSGESSGKPVGNESAGTAGTPVNGESETAIADTYLLTGESHTGLVKITRKEAGLSTIPVLDFIEYKLNRSIKRLLENPESFTDEDYRGGLIYGNFLIVSERFGENIIQNIEIGDSISKVTGILGKPSSITGNTIFYKTKDFYLGFKGEKIVEQAVLARKPGEYPKDILKTLLVSLNKPDFCGIPELLQQNSEISGFFDHNGHIHGGGWYAFTNNGVYIEEFTENLVVVYNNFEGDLYKEQEGLFKYGIEYRDSDFLMERLISELDSHTWLNEKFDEAGIVSPGGKYNSLYIWNYSESYYFIIRAMDAGSTDKYICLAATGDYCWINDRYILYSDFFSSAPYIVDVETCETIDLMEETGIGYEDFGFTAFEIESCKDGQIIIYCPGKDKEYLVDYSFDTDGKILLKSGRTGE